MDTKKQNYLDIEGKRYGPHGKLSDGTRVEIPHKGAMKAGKIVRYDKGNIRMGELPSYVVDVGEYESRKMPVHKVRPIRESSKRQKMTEEKDMSTTTTLVESIVEGDAASISDTLSLDLNSRIMRKIEELKGDAASNILEVYTSDTVNPQVKVLLQRGYKYGSSEEGHDVLIAPDGTKKRVKIHRGKLRISEDLIDEEIEELDELGNTPEGKAKLHAYINFAKDDIMAGQHSAARDHEAADAHVTKAEDLKKKGTKKDDREAEEHEDRSQAFHNSAKTTEKAVDNRKKGIARAAKSILKSSAKLKEGFTAYGHTEDSPQEQARRIAARFGATQNKIGNPHKIGDRGFTTNEGHPVTVSGVDGDAVTVKFGNGDERRLNHRDFIASKNESVEVDEAKRFNQGDPNMFKGEQTPQKKANATAPSPYSNRAPLHKADLTYKGPEPGSQDWLMANHKHPGNHLVNYQDARGVEKYGYYQVHSDRGGSDVTYFMRDHKSGALDIVSGSRLKKMRHLSSTEKTAITGIPHNVVVPEG